jgi:hypothetical protein
MKSPWSFDSDTGRTIVNLDEIAQFRREGATIMLMFKSGVQQNHHFQNVTVTKEMEDLISGYWGLIAAPNK